MAAHRSDVRDIHNRAARLIVAVIPFGLGNHLFCNGLAQAKRCKQVLLQHLLNAGIGRIKRVRWYDLAARIDQNIDPIEGINRGRDQIGHCQLFAQISRKGANIWRALII